MRDKLSIAEEYVSEAKVTDIYDVQWGDKFHRVLIGLWVGSNIFFAVLYLLGLRTSKLNYASNIYLVIPLFGGLFGFRQLNKVYKAQQPIRKTCLRTVRLFRFGLVLWAIGCALGMFYNFVYGVDVPYPTIGDAFFALCFLCWTIGIIFLYECARKNVLYELNSSIAKFLVPLWGGAVTYIYVKYLGSLDPSMSKTKLLAFILDFFFPIVDLLNLGLLITLLPGPGNEKLHIKEKPLHIIAFGYLFLCLASTSFTISHNLDEKNPYYYYSGGITDVMFATAFTILSIGISLIPLGQIIQIHEIEARRQKDGAYQP